MERLLHTRLLAGSGGTALDRQRDPCPKELKGDGH